MPKAPALPPILVGTLGVIATLLLAVQPQLSAPWDAIDAGVLGLLTLAGIPVTVRSVRAHGVASAAAARDEATK